MAATEREKLTRVVAPKCAKLGRAGNWRDYYTRDWSLIFVGFENDRLGGASAKFCLFYTLSLLLLWDEVSRMSIVCCFDGRKAVTALMDECGWMSVEISAFGIYFRYEYRSLRTFRNDIERKLNPNTGMRLLFIFERRQQIQFGSPRRLYNIML